MNLSSKKFSIGFKEKNNPIPKIIAVIVFTKNELNKKGNPDVIAYDEIAHPGLRINILSPAAKASAANKTEVAASMGARLSADIEKTKLAPVTVADRAVVGRDITLPDASGPPPRDSGGHSGREPPGCPLRDRR